MNCNQFPPLRREKKLIVLLPPSILSVEDSLIDKTNKVGLISRILSIFRVDDVVLYNDRETRRFDEKFLHLLLYYQVIPPHLKKKVFKKSKILKYTGILPPLRLVNHDPPKECKEGEILDGYVEKCDEKKCIVYLGKIGRGILDKKNLSNNKIITVKIKSFNNDKILLENSSWDNFYTGYRILKIKDFKEEIKRLENESYLIIGTSKMGYCINNKEIQEKLKKRITESKGIGIIFGGPHAELYDEKDEFDFIINTVVNQGTLTVRSEEALAATLSLFNYLFP
ncbi:MAG: putative RNA uridine N3 methyltransferase [Caldisphaera sp.]|nr:putative RNA uridine N3 methyltransferase [Caldisphaera sp.]PMP87878.1 MAG: hypothetical protein C0172_03910 [Caldisphaera sp.]